MTFEFCLAKIVKLLLRKLDSGQLAKKIIDLVDRDGNGNTSWADFIKRAQHNSLKQTKHKLGEIYPLIGSSHDRIDYN